MFFFSEISGSISQTVYICCVVFHPSSPAQHDSVINCRHAVINMIKCHIF